MCGILGYSHLENEVVDKIADLRKSLNLLAHRGPDSSGEYFDSKVYLGHRRLSIIDLSTKANQPLISQQGNAYIIFNGEVYNYRELRKSIENPVTESDTEVVLEGYLKEGKNFFSRLRGMFAFAIYDFRETPKLVLYRDMAGIKPLYYCIHKGSFAFASEIKSLRFLHHDLAIDQGIMKSYLALGYCLEPKTIYSQIKAVEPGECMTYDIRNGHVGVEKVAIYLFDQVNNLSYSQNLEKTTVLLKQAVNRNLVADVPISFSLSGGIDSSLIVALANKRDSHNICVKFSDDAYDESNVARQFADTLGLELNIVSGDVHGNLDLLNRIFLHFDQPYADSSAIPFYILSKQASELTKVLIGGDGGDEVQNGYPSFGWMPFVRKWSKEISAVTHLTDSLFSVERKRQFARLNGLINQRNVDDWVCEWSSWIPPSSLFEGDSPFKFNTDIIKTEFRESFSNRKAEDIQRSLQKNYFHKRMLSDYLRKADMMSMMHSLEYRVPMLDEDFTGFSLQIPYNHKSDLFEQKKLLRKIHSKTYPKATSYRKKSGFGIPLDKWLSHSEFETMKSIIVTKDSIVGEYVKRNYIDHLFQRIETKSPRNQLFTSRAAAYQRILMLYVLQLWYHHSYKD